MLQAPEKYLNLILSKTEIEKDITVLLDRLILNNKSNLHFIISEKELAIGDLLLNICKEIASNGIFTFKKGQKVLRISQARYIFKVQNISTEIELISDDKNNTRKSVCNLNN